MPGLFFVVTKGRPTEYHPDHCDTVMRLAMTEGASTVQMAVRLGVTRQTLHNWTAQYPEFLDAFTRAREASQAWWEDRARQGLDNREFNAQLWAKVVGARFKDYQQSSKIELSGPEGGPIRSITRRIVDPTGQVPIGQTPAGPDQPAAAPGDD